MTPSSRKRQALLFVLVLIAQLLALLGLIGQRELLLRRGEVVRLACRPLDPRSILSGDYVRLTYAISELRGPELSRLNRWQESFRVRETVYLALRRPAGADAHQPVALSHQRERLQGLGVILRGTVVSSWSSLELRYGVEDYFVPQREGLRLEQQLAEAVVEVAVSSSTGESAIKRLFVKGEEVAFY